MVTVERDPCFRIIKLACGLDNWPNILTSMIVANINICDIEQTANLNY